MCAIPFLSIPVFSERWLVAPRADGDGLGGALWRPPGAGSVPGGATAGPGWTREIVALGNSAGHQHGLEIVTISS